MDHFLDAAPAPTAAQLAKIEAIKAEANRKRAAEEESFQRCDTDGFLSQWALNIGAQKNDAEARLLANGGYHQFPVLVYDKTGEVVATKIYEFADTFRPDQWNQPVQRKWRLPDELAADLGRKWIPVAGRKNSRIQKQLGLKEELRWFRAEVVISSRGKSTGLSGAANAFVETVKVGN